jgi:hypothetical protein
MYVVTAQPDDSMADAATRMVGMTAELVQGVRGIKLRDGQAHLNVAGSATVGSSHTGVAGEKVPQFFVLGEVVEASLTLLETAAPSCLHMSTKFYECVDASRLPQQLQGFNKAPLPLDAAQGETVSYMVVMPSDSPMEVVAVSVSACVCWGGGCGAGGSAWGRAGAAWEVVFHQGGSGVFGGYLGAGGACEVGFRALLVGSGGLGGRSRGDVVCV